MQVALRFSSALVQESYLANALHHLEVQLAPQLRGTPPDLLLVFFSAHFAPQAETLLQELRGMFGARHVLGCSAEGIVGRGQEVERQPAISVLVAHLPEVNLTPFLLEPQDWQPLLLPDGLRAHLNLPEDPALFILLGDPFSCPADELLQAFNHDFPGVPVVGGMASAVMAPGRNALILDEHARYHGAVLLALSGNLQVDCIVSQGCRPIGRPLTVTLAQQNIVLQVENQPPLQLLQETIDSLSPEEQRSLRNGLLVGRAIDPQQEQFGRGDFLIRALMGADRESGALAIADLLHNGDTIQFHVRDAETATEDLEMLLIPQMFRGPVDGALLFSCNGRGARLFAKANQDVRTFHQSVGEHVPVAGFFCAGEIGPVHGRNFLHGHTVSAVLFRGKGSA
ncbi:MAG: FIST C-terminal domain-containing protein [Anaerolineales bacterium]